MQYTRNTYLNRIVLAAKMEALAGIPWALEFQNQDFQRVFFRSDRYAEDPPEREQLQAEANQEVWKWLRTIDPTLELTVERPALRGQRIISLFAGGQHLVRWLVNQDSVTLNVQSPEAELEVKVSFDAVASLASVRGVFEGNVEATAIASFGEWRFHVRTIGRLEQSHVSIVAEYILALGGLPAALCFCSGTREAEFGRSHWWTAAALLEKVHNHDLFEFVEGLSLEGRDVPEHVERFASGAPISRDDAFEIKSFGDFKRFAWLRPNPYTAHALARECGLDSTIPASQFTSPTLLSAICLLWLDQAAVDPAHKVRSKQSETSAQREARENLEWWTARKAGKTPIGVALEAAEKGDYVKIRITPEKKKEIETIQAALERSLIAREKYGEPNPYRRPAGSGLECKFCNGAGGKYKEDALSGTGEYIIPHEVFVLCEYCKGSEPSNTKTKPVFEVEPPKFLKGDE